MSQEIVPLPVAHPATGEVLDVHGATGDQLAEWHQQMRMLKAAADETLKDIDAELRQRMDDRTLWAAGAWEVSIESANRSVWDWEELEAVLRDLVEAGAVQAGHVTEVIHHETTGSAREADRLSKQLTGTAHDAVEACRAWERQRGRIVVKRSVQLPPPDSQMMEQS